VKNYRFVGGGYGKSNERNIMEELLANGPIVMSFEPGQAFMYYSSGVFHSVDASTWIKKGE
jgi:cathepsin C